MQLLFSKKVALNQKILCSIFCNLKNHTNSSRITDSFSVSVFSFGQQIWKGYFGRK